jgi:hypothetical protein
MKEIINLSYILSIKLIYILFIAINIGSRPTKVRFKYWVVPPSQISKNGSQFSTLWKSFIVGSQTNYLYNDRKRRGVKKRFPEIIQLLLFLLQLYKSFLN